MKTITSFSDKFLIEAAINYVYTISRYDVYDDPIEAATKMMIDDFKGRYKPVIIQNVAFDIINDEGKAEIVDLRYLLVEDIESSPIQHALIFQGSDLDYATIFSGKNTDWSNNLSAAVHLPVSHYENALKEMNRLNELNEYKITAVSGNSLGGAYALSLNETYPNTRIVAVNPAPPEYKSKYKESKYSTIINTSTDTLTRILQTDITRYKSSDYDEIKSIFSNDNLSITKKTQQFDSFISKLDYPVGYFYGFETFLVKRSLFFNESMHIEAAHRGTILEPREVTLEIFKNNVIPYSSGFASNAFSQTKELLEYSRYFLKLRTNLISSAEYRDLVDNYIKPAFKPIHTNKVKDFENFVSLSTFLQYDIMTSNLITQDGYLLTQSNAFKILDNESFINNLETSLKDYIAAISYPINRVMHDSEEERFFAENETDLKQTITFFGSTFDIGLNFNFDVVDLLKGLPITILIKIGSLLDKNWRFFKGLKESLITYFEHEASVLNDAETVKYYRDTYQLVNTSILQHHKNLISNVESIISNVKMVFDEDKLSKTKIHFIRDRKLVNSLKLIKPQVIDTDLIKKVKLSNNVNLLVKQYSDVLKIVDKYRVSSVDQLAESIKHTEEILRSGIRFINKKTSKHEEYRLEKLSKQLEAMLENIDLTTVYYNTLNVFRKDIASIALRNTVAQSIISNYHQIIETNWQLIAMLNNLSKYLESNTSKTISDKLISEIQVLKTDIEILNDYVKAFIQ